MMLETSVSRPAWTQYNLYAFNDKRIMRQGKFEVLKDFYVRSQGFERIQDLAVVYNETH